MYLILGEAPLAPAAAARPPADEGVGFTYTTICGFQHTCNAARSDRERQSETERERQTDRQTDRQTERKRETERERQTDRQTDREKERRRERQTETRDEHLSATTWKVRAYVSTASMSARVLRPSADCVTSNLYGKVHVYTCVYVHTHTHTRTPL